MLRLNKFSMDRYGKPYLISFPPEMESIPCKPVFFNKAVNEITFPDLQKKEEKKAWYQIW